MPIPSEEYLRHERQLPIETDPPAHTDERGLVESFFLRAREPAYAGRIAVITRGLLTESLCRDAVKIVTEFALPLQSRALAVLLGVDASEADRWIGWGVHVFHGPDGETKAAALDAYLHEQLDRAAGSPGDDFFGLLVRARLHGRPLTRGEMMGFANLAFAGGRDMIIHTVACILGHLAACPQDLGVLRADRSRIVLAAEEFFRVFMPLTHMGRVCPAGADVQGVRVPRRGRMSLGWAAANLDPAAFDEPCELRLDRRPHPHVSFGFGPHRCLGAAHSRTLVRELLAAVCDLVERIDLIDAVPMVEATASYERPMATRASCAGSPAPHPEARPTTGSRRTSRARGA